MLIDIVVFGIPVLIGLFVMWWGARRSLLSLPVRILAALLVAWLASTAASVYLVVGEHSLDAVSQRFGMPTTIVLAAIGWLVFLIVLLAVFLALRRLRSRVLLNATHSVGVVASASRFVVGAACGLLLVLCLAVPPVVFSEAYFPDPNQLNALVEGSISFPMIKYVSERARTWMQGFLPPSLEFPAAPTAP